MNIRTEATSMCMCARHSWFYKAPPISMPSFIYQLSPLLKQDVMRTFRVKKGKCDSNLEENMIDYSVKFRPLYPTILSNTDVREVSSTLSAIVSRAT